MIFCWHRWHTITKVAASDGTVLHHQICIKCAKIRYIDTGGGVWQS